MDILLSTDYYCYKIHTFLMKISAYLPCILCKDPPPLYMDEPQFLQENVKPINKA